MAQLCGKIMAKLLIRNTMPCYIISHDPVILISYWIDFYNNSERIISLLPKNKKSYLIFQLGYHVETEWRMKQIKTQFKSLENFISAGNIDYLFLCNSKAEEKMLKKNNYNAVFCNQNAFLDENNYHVIKDVNKIFDAVYLARITPIKCHELAAKVGSLKLIGDHKESEEDYFKKSMEILHFADWTRKVYAFNIYKFLNQARVGLCLSPEEGAMFVSAEYLLCGLPIVSIKSIGGRDTLFDDEYVSIVEDNPDAVAKGVDELIKKNIDPDFIRNKTIEKMQIHRNIFIDIIQDIYDKENKKDSFREEWPDVFIHKIGLRTNVPYKVLKNRILSDSSFRD